MKDELSSSQENAAADDGPTDQPQDISIQLFNNLLRAQLAKNQNLHRYGAKDWVELIFADGAIFTGHDELMWGAFVVCLYKDFETGEPSCMFIDKVGVSYFTNIDISEESQYFPAIENLLPADRQSEDRQYIAVTLLKKFAQLSEKDVRRVHPETFKFDYDPTHAGDLASNCKQIKREESIKMGRKLLSLGFLQNRVVNSTLLDVIYEYKGESSRSNNQLVLHLGHQLEQLFDPLTEYSPEQTEYNYKAPTNEQPSEQDSALIKAISKEFLELQTNFTSSLVEFLQKFVIVLRVEVLNGEIEGLSSVKLNRLFPPTIDEVTRINCIFLDSLKCATPFGSLEILKACNITIPYFYKAYTRHEAATRHFNKDIKLFLRNFSGKIPHPEVFTEMKIDSLIKGPQEKLMKIKLILDRLYASKEWAPQNIMEAKECYDNTIEVIDSFGRLKEPLSTYSSRVFTPSGKILTELAKGWPLELQYKWLKRRVVGVFDLLDPNDMSKKKLLVIFSDYLIFLDVLEVKKTSKLGDFKPSISNILMNSLVNEVPLPPTIPQLQVSHYCYIDEVLVTLFGDNCLRFDAFKGKNSFAVTYTVQNKSSSASAVADLVTKAKILEKDTAFHLFKAGRDDITMYSTAHEIEAYNGETIKSKFALFLNMNPTRKVIMQHKLHLAMFAKFVEDTDEEIVKLDVLTSDGGLHSIKVSAKDLVSTILRQLSFEIPVCFSSIYSPLLPVLLAANEAIVKKIDNDIPLDTNDTRTFIDNSKSSGSKSASNNPNFQVDHHPKKSYGTITTFRSDSNDIAKVEDNIPDDRFDFEEEMPTKMVQKNVEKPQNKVEVKKSTSEVTSPPLHQEQPPTEQPPTVKKAGKQQKRRSISNVFKSFFSGKRKANRESGKKERSTKKPTEVNLSKNSRKPLYSSGGQHLNERKSAPETSTKESFNQNGENSEIENRTIDANSEPKMRNRRKVSIASNHLESLSKRSRARTLESDKTIHEKRHLSLPLEPHLKKSVEEGKRHSVVSDIAGHSRFNSKEGINPAFPRDAQPQQAPSEENGSSKSDTVQLTDVAVAASESANRVTESAQSSNHVNDQSSSSAAISYQINSQSDFAKDSPNKIGKGLSAENLWRKTSRESQIFNDDLFGDVVPESKKSISPSNVDKTDTLNSSKNISVKQNSIGDLSNSSAQNDSVLTQSQQGTQMQAVSCQEQDHQQSSEPLTDKYVEQRHQKTAKHLQDISNDKAIKFAKDNKIILPDQQPKNVRSPPLQASKIKFDRSSSFVELFQGMRLVLDESDAKYNWKRLPSEYCLRDTNPISKTNEAAERQHAFKSIAFAGGNDAVKTKKSVSANQPLQKNSAASVSSNEVSSRQKLDQNVGETVSDQEKERKGDQVNRTNRSIPGDNAFVAVDKPALPAALPGTDIVNEANCGKKHDGDVNSKLLAAAKIDNSRIGEDIQSTGPPKRHSYARNKIPTFRVVDCSPTRIIQRKSPDRESTYNIASDYSISSDLNEQVNKRLFELKFPSQDNVKDNRFSPVKSPQQSVIRDMAYVSEASTPSLRNHDDSNSTPDDSIPERPHPEKNSGGLLDDLDFSSFNMTFDNIVKSREDTSQISDSLDPPKTIKTQEKLPTRIEHELLEGPIIYHLSENNNTSPATLLSNVSNKKRSKNEEDPIWISPSKLDYYDINRYAEPAFKDTEKMIRTVTNKSMHKMLADNPSSMKELSYAYLASMIDDEDEQFNINDGPVRLKFKE